MRPVVVLLTLVASMKAQPASVEGVVVNQATGQAMGDVHVRVLTGDLATLTVERVYGAMTDRAGHFSISNMKPGLYLLVPERTGFVFVRPPGIIPATVLALRAGQHVTNQRIEMTAWGFVTGRVVDDLGEPVAGVSLSVHAVPPDTDFVNPFAIPLPNFSDDHGEFRIASSPGKYKVTALPRPIAGPAQYGLTNYPERAGEGIEVRPGQDAGPFEIRLAHPRYQPAPLLSIGGLVTGTPAGGRASITVRPSQGSGPAQIVRGFSSDADGRFTFRIGAVGSFQVYAQFPPGNPTLQSQIAEVQLSESDVTDVQLNLAPGEELSGSLKMSGEAPGQKTTVKLEVADRGGPGTSAITSAEVDKLGSFHLVGVLPGRYRLEVEPMPERAFLASVMLDGKIVDDTGFDFSRGGSGARLQIAISRNAGEISGSVVDRNGAPLASALAAVLVWKNAAQVKPEFNMLAGGRYDLKGLRPGKYLILAVDAYDFTSLAGAKDQDEFAKALRAAAEEIEVAEGGRVTKDLRAAAKEDIHVQPK